MTPLTLLTSEGLPDVRGAVDPAVGLGVLREGLVRVAEDRLLRDVEVVLLADHDEPQQDHERRALKQF